MSMRGRMSLNRALALVASGLLGAGAALLSSCGGGGKLIPLANSEPLQRDFEEVAHAAENARGSCSATEGALAKAQSDLSHLPSSVDAGLRRRLDEGLAKLHADALEVCGQPASTTASTVPPATAPPSTPTTTPTNTTKTSTTPGGGAGAKEEKEREKEEEKEKEKEAEAGGTKPKEKGGDGATPPGESVLPSGGQDGGK
jgi:hypothetical protein